MDETLKACPFCGCEGDFVHQHSYDDWHYYECGNCRGRGPKITSRYYGDYGEHLDPTEQARTAWNRRTPDEDAMRRALEGFDLKKFGDALRAGGCDYVDLDEEYGVIDGRWTRDEIIEAIRAALSTTEEEG